MTITLIKLFFNMNINNEIRLLKGQRRAVILAHNYTVGEVQDIADFVGDSLELSRKAAECRAEVIVFCGVRFMAETAKVLSPQALVLHPNPNAGCPMADMASPDEVAKYRREHPDTLIVAYVNTTATTKCHVDICCTSGNAEKVIASLPPDRKIMFLPDGNLGRNIAAKLHREMEFWPGFCPTHFKILPEMITAARNAHPDAEIIIHPECMPASVALADAALSTGGMLRYVKESPRRSFIVATECGIVHRLQKENPGKEFFSLEPKPLCPNMKKISLEDVYFSLKDLTPAVELPQEVIDGARRPIEKMLEVKP